MAEANRWPAVDGISPMACSIRTGDLNGLGIPTDRVTAQYIRIMIIEILIIATWEFYLFYRKIVIALIINTGIGIGRHPNLVGTAGGYRRWNVPTVRSIVRGDVTNSSV